MPDETATTEGNRSQFSILYDEISNQIQSSDRSFEDKAKTETKVLQAIINVANGVEDAEDKLDKILKDNNIKIDKDSIPKPKEKNPLKRFWNNVKAPFEKINKKWKELKKFWKDNKKIIIPVAIGLIIIIIAGIFLL